MQDYNTIIGSIQMRLNGCQTRSVMDRYKIGSGTLNLIMSRYHANGIPIEELRMMAPKEVENLFYPQKNLQRKDVPLPDFQYYYDRIHAPGSRMNISFCWLDYKEKNPDGYEKLNILVTGNLDSGILETDIPEEGNSLIGLFTTYQVVRYCQAQSRFAVL